MSSNNKIAWFAPQWSVNAAAGKQWWATKKHMLSAGPLTRMSAVSIVSCGLVVLAFKIAVPAMVIPNLLPLLLVLPLLLGHVTLQAYLNSQRGIYVIVTPEKILISQGESTRTIKRDQLISVVLAIHDDGKSRIRLRYQRRGKSQLKTVGLSGEVSPVELEELLAIEITPRDYRRTKEHQSDESEDVGVESHDSSAQHALHFAQSDNRKIA